MRKEISTNYLDSMIKDGYQLREGVTRKMAVSHIADAYQADLDAAIAHAVEQATERATESWLDSLDMAEIDPSPVLWDTADGETEAEADEAVMVAKAAREAEHEAWLIAEAEAMAHALDYIPAVMSAGTRYRYNAPMIELSTPDPSIRARAIIQLLAKGILVKIERTSDSPPYLMLAEGH